MTTIELYAFRDDLRFLGPVPGVQSIETELRYNDAGSLDVVCDYSDRARALLACGNLLGLRKDRAVRWMQAHGRARRVQPPETAVYGRVADGYDGWIITRVTTAIDEDGGKITVYAEALLSLLARRVVETLRTYHTSAPMMLYDLVRRCCAEDAGAVRAYPRLGCLMPACGGAAMAREVSYKPLLDVAVAIAQEDAVGMDLVLLPRRRQMLWYAYRGHDRTGGEPFAGRVVLDDRRLESLAWEHDVDNLRTTALVAGAGEGAERRRLWVRGTPAGFARRELLVDARDISDEYTVEEQVWDADLEDWRTEYKTMKYTDAEYNPMLTARGAEKLEPYTETEQVTGEVSDAGDLWYGLDYALGDVVLVRSRTLGREARQRITAVRERYDAGGYMVTPVLGDETANVVDKLLAKLA